MSEPRNAGDEDDRGEEKDGGTDGRFSRRNTLGLLGATGVGAVLGRVSADGIGRADGSDPGDPAGGTWEGDVDADSHALSDLGALAMTDSAPISDFAGDGLSIQDGTLNATVDRGGSGENGDGGDDGNGETNRDVIHNVRYVDVAAGAEAVQVAVDEADDEGHNKVVVYGDEGEWNRTVYLPSEFTLEFRDGVTVTSTMTAADTRLFHGGAALITNRSHRFGDRDITVRGAHIDFEGVGGEVDTEPRWGPVWLHSVENARFEGVTVENVDWRYGMVFTDCTHSKMVDCRAYNIGYDGITLRGTCEHVDVVRCGTFGTEYGPGIQAAPSIGEGGTGGHHLNFIDCRMNEHLAIHGVRGGITDVGVQGCSVRRIGIIQNVDGFRISDCDVDTIAFSAFRDEIRNGRVDGCTMAPRYPDHDAQIPAGIVLWGLGNDAIENVTFSDCSVRGHDKFVECRLLDETSSARYIDFLDCAYDTAGADEPGVFLEHTPEGDQASVGEVSNIRVHGCKVWNTDTAILGPVDGLRIRLSEFHDVEDLHDDQVSDLETSQNDWW